MENGDIEKLIKDKYPDAEIIEGLDKIGDIMIKVNDVPTSRPNPTPQPIPPPTPLKIREKTIPGGAMGRERGNLPKY